MSRVDRTPSTAAGNNYVSIGMPNATVNPVVINSPVIASAPSDATYYTPRPPPESIDSGVPSASSSVFTTENDLYKTNTSGNIAAKKGNGLYSLESVSHGIDSTRKSDDGIEDFTIIENDLYRSQ